MNIKKLSFAAIAGLLLATSTTFYADSNMNSEKAKNIEVRAESALDKIELNEDQKLSIQAIKDTYQPQMDALHESKLALKDQHAALDPNSPDYEERSQILESQIAEIKAEKKALKKQMQEETKLALTPEQRSIIEDKNESPE